MGPPYANTLGFFEGKTSVVDFSLTDLTDPGFPGRESAKPACAGRGSFGPPYANAIMPPSAS